ncbi:conserved hypothetical protein [Beutenbergia cavernae DSM 12333]|uniref:Uncharacterized protein n=1 Tax=Beutenbergia cavernae (strain ATCC BAA-8 / DSM 12333 / CCUG 43141 / JCM 11478 / NBRC 16432 / NCIMB 13614 / HKI 0122) TaxID=471853 RepID=C5C6D9_BEUC1|nr:hypothetical protein [Beutenbergia cavernae]ACQ80345.1 conserved hypothetical protein [Beutenbergia cavernae DSM 12333]
MTLHTDIPTTAEITALWDVRSPAAVTLYVPTDPASTGEAERIEFRNLARQALSQLERAGRTERDAVAERLDHLHDDSEFWRYQARTLAVFATPDQTSAFRLPNRLAPFAGGGSRFFVKPLLRAVTFPQTAFVLALAIGSARVLETIPDAAPELVDVAGMPADLVTAMGPGALDDAPPPRRLTRAEGRDVRVHQYARQVEQALRTFLHGRGAPLVLAATEPMASAFRAVCHYPALAPGTVQGSPEALTDTELVAAAREHLDAWYASQLAALRATFEDRTGAGRTAQDVAEIARLVTEGAVETLFVDVDAVLPGNLDDAGQVTFTEGGEGAVYGIVDEIARRAWDTGARLLAVRREDVPGGGDAAAILRYAPSSS